MKQSPRAADDARMFLYHDTTQHGKLRWYVKVDRAGSRITMRHPYGTPEFDIEVDDAIRKLGGEPRLRRTEADEMIFDPRRHVKSDRSRHGQLRWYVQIRDKLPKVRIREDHGTPEFDRMAQRAFDSQVALYGNGSEVFGEPKEIRVPRKALPGTAPKPGTLRWFWTEYKTSDHWNGNESLGINGLGPDTKRQRVLLVEPLLHKNGEKPFSALTKQFLREEMKARTPSQAGNLLAALRGMTEWMKDHEPPYLKEDDDPTIGLKSGKAKASRKSGGYPTWSQAQITQYQARWPVGTEARLMLDILMECGFRLGDAYRFGPEHVRHRRGVSLVGDGANLVTDIETEKTGAVVNIAVSAELFASIEATETGEDVFVGKKVKGRIVPMDKESWGAKFKKYAVLAGINKKGQRCHGMRKASAGEGARSGMSESEMMKFFGWTDPKMPALYIAEVNGEEVALNASDKRAAYRERVANARKNSVGTNTPLVSNKWKKMQQNHR